MAFAFSVSCLNDLKKETIGETYKHLNFLLNEKSNESALKNLIQNEDSLSQFEESLKLIIIHSLQLKNSALTILLSQNNYQIKKILNCTWLFTDVISPEELCDKIIPIVSIKVRNKLINKLANVLYKEEAAEKLFIFIRENYSKAQAELFLNKCSLGFIENYLLNEKQFFKHQKSCKILFYLSKRFPNLVVNLFAEVLNNPEIHFDCNKHLQVLKFLAGHHPDLFIPFYVKNYSKLLSLRFGAKLSRKLGPKLKPIVLESNVISKSDVFNNSALLDVFDFNDQIKLLANLIKSEQKKLTFLNWINCAYTLHLLLRKIKPTQRLAIIESVFNEVYNSDLWNHMILCEPKILELIPLEKRTPCVVVYEKEISNLSANGISINRGNDFYEGLEDWQPFHNLVDYVYLYPFEDAFPRLKNLLSKTPNLFDRQDILRAMTENCRVNKDLKNLDEVVNYVASRFRNDAPVIFIQFIDEVYHSFPPQSLSLNVIEKIEEMLYLCFVKRERKGYEYLLEKCLLHRLANDLNVNQQVQFIINWKLEDNNVRDSFVRECESPHGRQLFLKYFSETMERMKKIESTNPKLLKSLVLWILWNLKEFNEKCKKNPISLSDVPEFVPYVIALMKENGKGIVEDFDITMHLDDPNLLNDISTPPNKLIKRILKRRPQVVEDKLQELLTYLSSDYLNNYNRDLHKLFSFALKVFSFKGVLNKIQTILIEKFTNGKTVMDRKKALLMMSRVQTLEEFEKTVEGYLPKGDKIDIDALPEFTEIQLLIPGVIKNLTPSWKNINFIFKFFKGEFFRSVITSFYVCCHNTRVDRLIPILVEYFQKMPKDEKLSIKKELIRILLRVSDFKKVAAFCKQFWDHIDHYSVRTIVLKKISSMFLEKPADETFKLLTEFISESDEIVIVARPNLKEIPREFFSEYVMALWAVSESKLLSIQNEIQKSVVCEINAFNINLLSKKFCEEIIKNNLFVHGLDVKQLAAYYVLADSHNTGEKVDFIIKILKNSSPDAHLVSEFFRVLRSTALAHPKFACDMYENLFKKWPYADSTLLFDDRLLFNYSYLYFKIKLGTELGVDEVSKRFGEELKTFYFSHANLIYLIPIFLDSLKKFLNETLNSKVTFDWLLIFKELLKGHKDTSLAILVILAMMEDDIKLYKMEGRTFNSSEIIRRKNMSDIVTALNEFQNEVVQIYFNGRFGFKR